MLHSGFTKHALERLELRFNIRSPEDIQQCISLVFGREGIDWMPIDHVYAVAVTKDRRENKFSGQGRLIKFKGHSIICVVHTDFKDSRTHVVVTVKWLTDNPRLMENTQQFLQIKDLQSQRDALEETIDILQGVRLEQQIEIQRLKSQIEDYRNYSTLSIPDAEIIELRALKIALLNVKKLLD